MNKHIKQLVVLLSNSPDYNTESVAINYLKEVINSGTFKPKYTLNEYYVSEEDKRWIHNLAVTLSPDIIGEHYIESFVHGEIVREVDYVVYGLIHEDYYEWVNFFVCVSTDGKNYIVGDLEDVVYYSSKKFYDKFINAHKPVVWDYLDI